MDIKKMKPVLLALILPILISACTSTPYTRYTSPKLSGHISMNGNDAAGIPIYLSQDGNDKSCFKVKTRTQTSEDGNFMLSPLKQQMNYTPLMTYYLDEWNLCADVNGKRVLIYSDNRYGTGSVASAVHLECNFDSTLLSARACKRINP